MGPNSVLISGSQVPTCGMFNFQMGGKMKTVQTQDHCSNTMLNYHLSNGEWAHLFFPLSMYMTVSNSLCIDHSHTRIFCLGGFLLGRTLAAVLTITLSTSMAARLGPLAMAAHQICLQVWLSVSLLADAQAGSGQVCNVWSQTFY